ncbi:MAG: hypothetical protein RIR86_1118 [Acidobacteriota bacterium]
MSWMVVVLVGARPRIGGIDFAYYVIIARDIVDGLGDAVPGRHFYSPGIYFAWRSLMRLLGRDLANLQQGYVIVLLLVGVLTMWVTQVVTRRRAVAILAGTFTLILLVRVEGLEGNTEPFVLVPFLAGAAIFGSLWRGGHLYGGVVVLGLAVAASFFFKQQGAFLGLGAALALSPALWMRGAREALGMAVTGIVATGAGILLLWQLDGGVAALRISLASPASYPAEADFLANVIGIAWPLKPLVLVFMLTALVVVVEVIYRRGRIVADLRTALVSAEGVTALVVAGGSAACILQLMVRNYLHYTILVVPGAVVLCALGLARPGQKSPLAMRAAGVMALYVVVSAMATLGARIEALPPYQRILDSYADICSQVAPGSELLVVPASSNAVHLACGTRAHRRPTGYGWAGSSDAGAAAVLERFEAVAFDPDAAAYPATRDAALASGFRQVTPRVMVRISR